MWTCACQGLNKSRDRICTLCGLERDAAVQAPVLTKLTRCPADGAAIQDGRCVATGLFPMTESCPFVCPICRKPLEWSGACYACHGTTSGRREDWAFQGDRYELEDGHWIKQADGPRRACTPAENHAGSKALRLVLAGATLPTPVGLREEEEVPF